MFEANPEGLAEIRAGTDPRPDPLGWPRSSLRLEFSIKFSLMKSIYAVSKVSNLLNTIYRHFEYYRTYVRQSAVTK